MNIQEILIVTGDNPWTSINYCDFFMSVFKEYSPKIYSNGSYTSISVNGYSIIIVPYKMKHLMFGKRPFYHYAEGTDMDSYLLMCGSKRFSPLTEIVNIVKICT